MAIEIQSILKDLPDDPTLALITMGERLQKVLDVTPSDSQQRTECLIDAISVVEKWCKINNFRCPKTDKAALRSSWEKICNYLTLLNRNNREQVIEEELMAVAAGEYLKFGYARLDPTEKEQIHSSLNQIRKIVEASDLPENKKNALYNKLNELAAEVDRSGTRTDAFFGLLGDLGIHLGKFGENAKPLRKEITKILKAITRSRARSEDVALPGGEELPLLGTYEDNSSND